MSPSTSAAPDHVDEHSVDRIALEAARRLAVGGVLVVLTHCDWTGGVLIDPTGLIVTAAQNADLLYLQHIVAMHHPPGGAPQPDGTARPAAPAHRRIHSDVLVFTQPHDHGLVARGGAS